MLPDHDFDPDDNFATGDDAPEFDDEAGVEALMRGIDMLMAFPYLLLALAIVAALGPVVAWGTWSIASSVASSSRPAPWRTRAWALDPAMS